MIDYLFRVEYFASKNDKPAYEKIYFTAYSTASWFSKLVNGIIAQVFIDDLIEENIYNKISYFELQKLPDLE